MTFGFSAFAAGTDSRIHTCAELHGLITAQGFVFINNADYQDFVVANASYCEGGNSAQVQRRMPGKLLRCRIWRYGRWERRDVRRRRS
jgi:hypothetical protein